VNIFSNGTMEVFELKLAEMRSRSWSEWKGSLSGLYADFPDSRRDILPTNFLEGWWSDITSYYGDFYLLVGFYLFMNACYMIGSLFFWFCDHYRWFSSYKIQQGVRVLKISHNLFRNMLIIWITFAVYLI
jgi:hypothetical protein